MNDLSGGRRRQPPCGRKKKRAFSLLRSQSGWPKALQTCRSRRGQFGRRQFGLAVFCGLWPIFRLRPESVTLLSFPSVIWRLCHQAKEFCSIAGNPICRHPNPGEDAIALGEYIVNLTLPGENQYSRLDFTVHPDVRRVKSTQVTLWRMKQLSL